MTWDRQKKQKSILRNAKTCSIISLRDVSTWSSDSICESCATFKSIQIKGQEGLRFLKNTVKKIVCFLCLFSVLCLGMCGTSEASTFYYRQHSETSAGHSFSKKWKVSTYWTWNTTCGGLEYTIGSFIDYGFDTWWTDEDYVENVGGQPTGWGCHGIVTNSNNSSDSTSWIWGNTTGGSAEVTHTGTPVTYTVEIKLVFD